MRVFVTGATGFVGTAIVRELLAAGHGVLGLARSDASAAALARAGAQSHRGDLEDLASIAAGASACDGVIHCGYDHAFVDMAAAAAKDRATIEAIGTALAGGDRPLVIASGLAGLAVGRLATEDDLGDPASPTGSRLQAELLTVALAQRGIRSSVMRLPPSVHGEGDHGFVPRLVAIAREKGVSAYVGDGTNRWASVHRTDAASAFRLALERGVAGSRFHAVADEGVPTREIAESIGRGLDVPVKSISSEEINGHFGWLGHFFALDIPASSALTRERLGWTTHDLGLLADLDHPYYFIAEVPAS